MKQSAAESMINLLNKYRYSAGLCRNGEEWYVSVADPATVSSGGSVVRVEFETRYLKTVTDVFKFIDARI